MPAEQTNDGSKLIEDTSMRHMPFYVQAPTVCMMGAKGQAGLSAELADELHTTTLNPVLLDAIGTWWVDGRAVWPAGRPGG